MVDGDIFSVNAVSGGFFRVNVLLAGIEESLGRNAAFIEACAAVGTSFDTECFEPCAAALFRRIISAGTAA